MPQIVWTAEPYDAVDYANEVSRTYSGEPDLFGPEGGWTRILHPDDIAPTLAAWGSAVARGEVFETEYRIFRAADSSYRWYIEFATPSCGTVHRERIDTTADDRKRQLNRAEHLRQHVKTDEGDSVYDRCYGWREDSECLNNTLDRTLHGGRMTAYTAVRQLTVILGFALGRNAIAAHLHRRRKPRQGAA